MPRTNASLVCLLLTIALGAAACSGDDVTAPPTSGSLEVTASTTGAEPDADGYSVQVDALAPQTIEPGGTVRMADIAPGDHTIQLAGLAPNCAVSGENPRTIGVTAGKTTSVTFEVTCGVTSGGLQVTSATSGVAPDADGYNVTVDGSDAGVLAATGGLTVNGLLPGDHVVGLSGVAANCQVDGQNPRTVTVIVGQSGTVAFAVTCAAPPANAGTIRVVTATTGPDPDPNGYRLAVDGGGAQPIGVNATSSLANVATGSHRVALSDVARNCTVQGENPRSVSVSAGATAEVSFAITCGATTGTIRVSVSTSGTPVDPDGYTVKLDGQEPGQPVAVSGTATLSSVPAGNHQVELTGVAPNCSIADGTSRTVSVSAGASVELSFAVVCTSSSGSSYQRTDLDLLPVKINNLGHIAGTRNGRAILWRDGVVTDLGTVGGVSGLNNHDVVVGTYTTETGEQHGFLWDGTRHDLGSDFFPTEGINDAGQMVGFSSPGQPAFRSNGVTIAIDCDPESLNNLGQVLGSFFFDTQQGGLGKNACIWDGARRDLGVDLDKGTATDINDKSTVVGVIDNGLRYHAFLWENGTTTSLSGLGGNASAQAVNDDVIVVGRSQEIFLDGAPSYPVVWKDGKAIKLAEEPGDAEDINDGGQIVGTVLPDGSEGSRRGVVWSPTP